MNVVVADEKDIEALENGSIDKSEFIDEKILGDIKNLEDDIKSDRWKVLSQLIKREKIIIKVGVVPGNVLHAKIGIFYDLYDIDNVVSFIGSTNESISGWVSQANDIEVFRSWKNNERVKRHRNSFERLWNNRAKVTKVHDLSEAVKNSLIYRSGLKILVRKK